MTYSSGVFTGDEFHAHLFGALGQLPQDPFAVTLLVVVLSLIAVFLALGEHRVDKPRQLVRGSRHGLGLIHARAHPAEVRAQRRLAAAQCRCGQSQGLGRTVGDPFGLAAHHLAAGDLGTRTTSVRLN